MSTRPPLVDFRSQSHGVMKSPLTSGFGQHSPRITHFDGEIPPAMSPLDAFAAQSRLLAKQLDDSETNGRRASRLPPLTIANSLARTGSGFTHTRSDGPARESPSTTARSRDEYSSGSTPDIEEPFFRPTSLHPRLSGQPPSETQSPQPRTPPDQERFITPVNYQSAPPPADYFGYPRRGSPEPLPPVSKPILPEPIVRPSPWNSQRSFDSTSPNSNPSRTQSIERSSPKPREFSGLAPPMSPHVRQAGSIRSVPGNSSDEDLSASTGGSSFSQQRKLSSSSGVSMPQSPMPQFVQAHARSPSVNSDYSMASSRRGRTALNFSRPISRSGRLSAEMASRQPSFDSRPSLDSRSRQPSSDSQRIIFTDDTTHTPVSMDHEPFQDPKDYQDTPAPSYIYAKYSLPRGRMLSRDSRGFEYGVIHRLEWEQSPLRGTLTPATPLTGEQPMLPTSSPNGLLNVMAHTPSTADPSSAARDRSIGHQSTSSTHPDDKSHASSASTRSGSTIKARSPRPATSANEMSAEQHLAKAIELHEHGSLKESTYHLRIAAKQSLPTAMLLYALACRHGWGMRPNPQEGVQWLRKAADHASLEIADDESQCKKGAPGGDVQERKTRRAQFALSIYELGVSHMNGWGIEQDKALALRCFEIAGNWGDADALAEAGFCYAQGTGCKKDLRKAAKYYRMAEAKGISMVGNSWYVHISFSSMYLSATNPQSQGSTNPNMPMIRMIARRDPRPKCRRRRKHHEINLARERYSEGKSPSVLKHELMGWRFGWGVKDAFAPFFGNGDGELIFFLFPSLYPLFFSDLVVRRDPCFFAATMSSVDGVFLFRFSHGCR